MARNKCVQDALHDAGFDDPNIDNLPAPFPSKCNRKLAEHFDMDYYGPGESLRVSVDDPVIAVYADEGEEIDHAQYHERADQMDTDTPGRKICGLFVIRR